MRKNPVLYAVRKLLVFLLSVWLLSLAVFPIAFFFMMMVMGGYAKDFAGAVQATGHQ